LTPWQLSRTVFDELVANNVFGRAAELAFYFLFALFPLIFLLMTLLAFLPPIERNFKMICFAISQIFFHRMRSNF